AGPSPLAPRLPPSRYDMLAMPPTKAGPDPGIPVTPPRPRTLGAVRDPHAKLFCAWRDPQDTAELARPVHQIAPDLLRLALHLSRGPADAEDLVQQTFLTAMESAQDFAPDRPLLPWLSAILRHCAHNARRRAGRELQSPSGTPETAILATDQDPAAQALAGETAEQVLVALDRLAEPYRQPALL